MQHQLLQVQAHFLLFCADNMQGQVHVMISKLNQTFYVAGVLDG